MSTTTKHPIELANVWKRYQIGSHDSLRDALPGLLRRWTRRTDAGTPEGEFWALSDVSFHVRQGETLGIVGSNGAGKSTIHKLLSRITTQTKGALRVHGLLAALIELGGGFHPDLTGEENIYLQGTMLGLRHREIRRLYDSIVAFSELEKFLKTPVKRYSSGMVVRLGFAVAAHVHPDVLLIDEVLAVGDLAFQQKCFRRIDELRQAGTTMIFISHNLEAVQKLCDRVLLLKEGRVIGEGTPAEMIRRYHDDVSMRTARTTPVSTATAESAFQIDEIALRDSSGNTLETLESGTPLRVEMAFTTRRLIRQPVVRVAIERLDGLLCHATTTRSDHTLPEVLTGAGTLTLEYPSLNLLPNLYQVTVEVFEEGNPIPLAAVRQGHCFQITTDHHEQGAVHLDHHWTMNGHQAA